MKKPPKFSIITVCYNAVNTIENTISSVREQTFKDFEHIIIDGGSTDGTLDIIKKYQDGFSVVISEPDEGVYDAMNRGVKLALGEYINFMNAGDLFFNKYILEKISKNLKADLVYGDHANYKGDPHIYEIICAKERIKYDNRNIPFCHQSLFINIKWLHEIPFDINYKIAADYDHYLKCKTQGASILYLPFTVSLFLTGGISLSLSSRSQLIKEMFNITKRYNFFSALFFYAARRIKLHFL